MSKSVADVAQFLHAGAEALTSLERLTADAVQLSYTEQAAHVAWLKGKFDIELAKWSHAQQLQISSPSPPRTLSRAPTATSSLMLTPTPIPTSQSAAALAMKTPEPNELSRQTAIFGDATPPQLPTASIERSQSNTLEHESGTLASEATYRYSASSVDDLANDYIDVVASSQLDAGDAEGGCAEHNHDDDDNDGTRGAADDEDTETMQVQSKKRRRIMGSKAVHKKTGFDMSSFKEAKLFLNGEIGDQFANAIVPEASHPWVKNPLNPVLAALCFNQDMRENELTELMMMRFFLKIDADVRVLCDHAKSLDEIIRKTKLAERDREELDHLFEECQRDFFKMIVKGEREGELYTLYRLDGTFVTEKEELVSNLLIVKKLKESW